MIIKTNVIKSIIQLGTFNTIELKDGYVIRRWKVFGFIPGVSEAFKADTAIFFDRGQGLFGKSVHFGRIDKDFEDKRNIVTVDGEKLINWNPMDIFGLKASDADAIKQYLIDSGAQLTDVNAKEYKSHFPFLNPFRWFSPRETVSIGTNGIYHNRRTLRKSRTTYIPYDNLKIFCGRGLFGKKLTILGDASANTRERFSRDAYNEISDIVKKRTHAKLVEGKMFRPALFSFRRRNKYILLLDDGFVARYKKETYYFDYNDIDNYGFDRKHAFSIFGTFWCTAFREDARDSSLTNLWINSSVRDFNVPGIPFWKWRFLLVFKGSLKKILKQNCKKAKELNRQMNKALRKQDRKDSKEWLAQDDSQFRNDIKK